MPIPRDWRKYRKNPKMFSWEIIATMKKEGVRHFTSSDVAEMMNIKPAEACTRLNILKRYNCVKVISATLYPAVYEITSWGYQYVSEKEKEYDLV